MKQFLLSTLFLNVFFNSLGQCPTFNLNFSTQQEINDFGINYPDCTEVEGRLTISGEDIVDLTPLSNITRIQEFFIIDNNPLLNSLVGLHNIDFTAFGLYISNNPLLEELIGLEGFNNIDELGINDNAALSSLRGLHNLTFTSSFYIANNPYLIDLTGLESLHIVENFSISGNEALQTFSGLDSYSGSNELSIRNNPSLVNISHLNNINSIEDYLEIVNNDSLESLDGIGQVESYYFGLKIRDNQELRDISAIANWSTPSMSMFIEGNPLLETCSIDLVCSYIDIALESESKYIGIANNAAGCNSVQEVENACALSLQEKNLGQTLSLYPNPAQHTIHISAAMDDSELVEVKVFSTSGKMLLETNGFAVDVSELATGIYFMEIHTVRDVIIRQFIKD